MHTHFSDLLGAFVPASGAILLAGVLGFHHPAVQGAVQLPLYHFQPAVRTSPPHVCLCHGVHLHGLGVHLLLPELVPTLVPTHAAVLLGRVSRGLLGPDRAQAGPRRVPVLGARQRRQSLEGRHQAPVVEGHARRRRVGVCAGGDDHGRGVREGRAVRQGGELAEGHQLGPGTGLQGLGVRGGRGRGRGGADRGGRQDDLGAWSRGAHRGWRRQLDWPPGLPWLQGSWVAGACSDSPVQSSCF